MKPTVGRIVHYVSYGAPKGEFGSTCRAAIVTEVSDQLADPNTLDPIDQWWVGLAVLNPTGLFFYAIEKGGCPQNEQQHNGGTWHWPEREES